MDILLISVGLVCILASIVGGGLKALNIEIPALRTTAQSILFLGLGLTLMIVGFYVHYQHPPGDPAGITATTDRIDPYLGPCPGSIVVTGSMAISEGKGEVNYHSVFITPEGQYVNGTPLTVFFPGPGTQKISDTLNLYSTASGQFFFSDG